MTVGPQFINRGNVDSTFILTVSLTPAATAAATTLEQTFTVPGLLPGDQISNVTFNGALATLVDIINARVSAANTIALAFSNNTAGSLTYPSGQFLIEVNRPAGSFTMTGIQ